MHYLWYYECANCGRDDCRYADRRNEIPKRCDGCDAKITVDVRKLRGPVPA